MKYKSLSCIVALITLMFIVSSCKNDDTTPTNINLDNITLSFLNNEYLLTFDCIEDVKTASVKRNDNNDEIYNNLVYVDKDNRPFLRLNQRVTLDEKLTITLYSSMNMLTGKASGSILAQSVYIVGKGSDKMKGNHKKNEGNHNPLTLGVTGVTYWKQGILNYTIHVPKGVKLSMMEQYPIKFYKSDGSLVGSTRLNSVSFDIPRNIEIHDLIFGEQIYMTTSIKDTFYSTEFITLEEDEKLTKSS